jgi:hypothetical protein
MGWLIWKNRTQNPGGAKHAVFLWVLGLVTFPLMWETIYQSVYFIVGADRLRDFEFHTYFYYIVRQFLVSVPVFEKSEAVWFPAFYPTVILKTQGWVFAATLGASFIWIVLQGLQKRLNRWHLLFFLEGAVVLVAWILKTGYIGTRVIIFFVPFLCLTLGWFLSEIRWRSLKIVLFLLAIAPAIRDLPKIRNYKAGYAEASRFIESQGQAGILTFEDGPIWHFYLGQKKIFRTTKPFSETKIAEAVRDGKIRYLAVDYVDVLSKEKSQPEKQWVQNVQHQVAPVKTFENLAVCDDLFLCDRYELQDKKMHPEACSIRLYDLQDLFGADKPRA